MRAKSRRHRAFSLVEILIVLGLFGLIALAGGRLFNASVRLSHDSSEAANAAASFDSLLAMLRADAWSANAMQIEKAGAVAMLKLETSTVTWSVTDGVLARSDGRTSRAWPIGPGATFSVAGPSLALRIPASRTYPGGKSFNEAETVRPRKYRYLLEAFVQFALASMGPRP